RARGGREALELFDQEGADLVLLDVLMPGLDGLDVLTHIRARSDRPYVPVVLVTAHSERQHRLRGLEAGADDFLEKPVDQSILVARVRTLLRLKVALDELRTRNAELEQLQREQRELTQFIVHDLKNPITVMYANLQFLQQCFGSAGDDIAEAVG